jgi:hypothetical protein
VKNNSPMVEKDLERRVKKLNIFYTLWDEGRGRMTQSWVEVRGGRFFFNGRQTPEGNFPLWGEYDNRTRLTEQGSRVKINKALHLGGLWTMSHSIESFWDCAEFGSWKFESMVIGVRLCHTIQFLWGPGSEGFGGDIPADNPSGVSGLLLWKRWQIIPTVVLPGRIDVSEGRNVFITYWKSVICLWGSAPEYFLSILRWWMEGVSCSTGALLWSTAGHSQ